LTAAFDVVNRKLLLKRLKIIGFSKEYIRLIRRMVFKIFCVEIKNASSVLKQNDHGTIEGPIVFSIFILPIYSIINLSAYADDNYLLDYDKDILATIGKIQMKSTIIHGGFKNSGLKINPEKTEFCIF